ncbi:MAG: hypothetical protein O3A10_02540 [Chloroflexi bacterium]|nr:hypothetical protein [Chloroflexota bacterium]MDA1145217.1 hypothetical protein [Chloroflexota bacterium]
MFTTAAAAYAWPDDPWPPTRTTIVGQSEEFTPGTVTYLGDLGVVGYLARLEDGEFLAFDRQEPVFGCTLVWGRPGSAGFSDPCHGFEYDISGEPVGGNPILKPMDRFEVHIDRYGTIRVVQPVEAP